MSENNKTILDTLQQIIKNIADNLQKTADDVKAVYGIIEKQAGVSHTGNTDNSCEDCVEMQPELPVEPVNPESFVETQGAISSGQPVDEPVQVVAEQTETQIIPVNETEDYKALEAQLADMINKFNEKEKEYKTKEEQYQNEIAKLKKKLETLNLNKYKAICESLLLREVNAIAEPINNFVGNVMECYVEDQHVIYRDAENIKDGYKLFCNQLSEILEKGEPNIESDITEILEKYLQDNSSNNWVNTIFRLSEYAKIEKCNIVLSLTDCLKEMGEMLRSMYSRYNIEIVIPTLLIDEFDEERFDYDNNGTIWINKYCDLEQRDYKNRVYDLVQVGYIKPEVGFVKPKVYSV